MDAGTIAATISTMGIESDPALRDLDIYIQPIPQVDGTIVLGLYYSNRGTRENGLIIIPKDGDVSTLKHELGHRYGDYYYYDLSEEFARAFALTYSGSLPRLLVKGSYIECMDCHTGFYAPGGEAACPRCGAVYRRVRR